MLKRRLHSFSKQLASSWSFRILEKFCYSKSCVWLSLYFQQNRFFCELCNQNSMRKKIPYILIEFFLQSVISNTTANWELLLIAQKMAKNKLWNCTLEYIPFISILHPYNNNNKKTASHTNQLIAVCLNEIPAHVRRHLRWSFAEIRRSVFFIHSYKLTSVQWMKW